MGLGLAARPLIHSSDAAAVAFATLVGPVAAPDWRTPKTERDLLATVAHELRSRYSIEGDEIELSVSTVGQQLRIRVTDHGPGISPEDQQRIFGAWVRGQSSYSGGLGLGLSIVQNLVQQQGGRVGVESTLGQGAIFWFTLPAAGHDSVEEVDTCRR